MQIGQAPSVGGEKLVGVEILRFACAFAILVWHYTNFLMVGDTPVGLIKGGEPFYDCFGLFYTYGYTAVQVFWCISGFIFFYNYAAAINRRSITGRKFFWLRFSRLYPLHFLTLLAVAVLQYFYYVGHQYYFDFQGNTVRQFILHLFMASNWPIKTEASFNNPIWSVSAEVLVYCVFFFLCKYIRPSFLFAAGVVVVTMVLTKWTDYPAIQCARYFFLGGIAALLRERVALLRQERSRLVDVALGGGVVAIIVAACFVNVRPSLLIMAVAPPLIFLTAKYISPKNEGCSRVLGALGNMTYASYLLHFPLQIGIALVFAGIGAAIPFYSKMFFIAFIGITLCSAYCCHRWVEMPLQEWIRRRALRK